MADLAAVREHCDESIIDQRTTPDVNPDAIGDTGIPLPFRKISELEKQLKVSDEHLEHNQELLSAVYKLVDSIADPINERTRSSSYRYSGLFKRVGSAKDGTRPGNIMEVDYLFICKLEQRDLVLYQTKKSKVDYKVYETSTGDNSDDEDGDEILPSMLNDSFKDIVDEVFLNNLELPKGLKHAGFAHPRYSGVRRNGPATTLLFKWKKKLVSIDMTLALPLPDEEADLMSEKMKKKMAPIRKDNDETPFDLVQKVHLVPKPPDEKLWQLTTSLLEAEVVHQLNDHAPVKKIIKLQKIIIDTFEKKAEKAVKHNAPKNAEEEQRTTKALQQLLETFKSTKQDEELRRDIMKNMRYAHVFLPDELSTQYQELPKRPMSMRSYAIKHLTLAKGAEIAGSFSPKEGKKGLELLISAVFEVLANDETKTVNHFFLESDIQVWSWATYGTDKKERYVAIAKGQCERIVEKFQQRRHNQTPFAQRKVTATLPWTLLCRGCGNFACTTLTIRRSIHHLVVIDKEFLERIKSTEFTGKKKFEDQNFEKTHDAECRICGYDWGILTNYLELYSSVPLIKIRSFLIKPDNWTDSQEPLKFKKPSETPSDTFQDLKPSELQEFPTLDS